MLQFSYQTTSLTHKFPSLLLPNSSCTVNEEPDSCGMKVHKDAPSTVALLRQLIEERVPDVYMTHGTSQSPPPMLFTNDDKWITNACQLRPLCEQAKCGRGSETVLDLESRKTLETSSVKMEWPGLEEALRKSSAILMPGFQLAAHLYKVLLYQQGDFFRPHVDSRRDPRHMLTLVVDCGLPWIQGQEHTGCDGGVLRFSESHAIAWDSSTESEVSEAEVSEEDDCENTPDEHPQGWQSTGPGDWCCWHTSQVHSIDEVTRGHRVVAMYDIYAQREPEEPALISCQLRSSARLLQLPPPVLQQILLLLNLKAGGRVACACVALRQQLPRNSDLLHLFLTDMREEICREAEQQCVTQLGFVLHHKYSLDGAAELNPEVLRGRDRSLYEAIADMGECQFVGCQVVFEKLLDRSGDSARRVCNARIAQKPPSTHEEDFHWEEIGLEAGSIAIPAALERLAGGPTLTKREVEFLTETRMECDEDIAPIWPFRDVVWLSSTSYLSRCFDGIPDKGQDTHLWGNAATFAIYRYQHVALLWQVRQRNPGEPKATFAQDLPQDYESGCERPVTVAGYPFLSRLDQYGSYQDHDDFFEEARPER